MVLYIFRIQGPGLSSKKGDPFTPFHIAELLSYPVSPEAIPIVDRKAAKSNRIISGVLS
jgi:hypothetical protein